MLPGLLGQHRQRGGVCVARSSSVMRPNRSSAKDGGAPPGRIVPAAWRISAARASSSRHAIARPPTRAVFAALARLLRHKHPEVTGKRQGRHRAAGRRAGPRDYACSVRRISPRRGVSAHRAFFGPVSVRIYVPSPDFCPSPPPSPAAHLDSGPLWRTCRPCFRSSHARFRPAKGIFLNTGIVRRHAARPIEWYLEAQRLAGAQRRLSRGRGRPLRRGG